jgi:transposase-like protein
MTAVLSVEHFHSEEAAYEYVEARLWPNGPTCPHCGNADAAKIGRLANGRPGLRKCYACRKQFTVKVGTVFEDSHLPMQLWLQAIHLLAASKKGFSTAQLQRTLGCGMKTAWFLSHRIREMMGRPEGSPPLGGAGGTIEADWTYVGRKPGTKVGRAGAGHLNVVFALVERGGAVRSFNVPDVTSLTLPAVLREQADKDSHLRTDEAQVFRAPGARFLSHETVTHSADEYVRGDVYTNTIEGFFSVLKRGINGTYQSVSQAHLHRYLSEFDFRYSNRKALGVDDVARADLVLKGAAGKRLTYETTRSHRRAQAS